MAPRSGQADVVEPSAPLTVAEARALLGHTGAGMTDDDVRAACQSAAVLASILIDLFLESSSPTRRLM